MARRCVRVETWCQNVSYGPNKNAYNEGYRIVEEGEPSGSIEDRITQLKSPVPFDFGATNLADSWKRWRQEVEL